MGRSAWPSMLVVALLLAWLEPSPSAAQSPPTPDAPTSTARPSLPAQGVPSSATSTATIPATPRRPRPRALPAAPASPTRRAQPTALPAASPGPRVPPPVVPTSTVDRSPRMSAASVPAPTAIPPPRVVRTASATMTVGLAPGRRRRHRRRRPRTPARRPVDSPPIGPVPDRPGDRPQSADLVDAARLRGCHQAAGRAPGGDRPPLPDQPGHRLAAVRRPSADRGRRAGQRVGGRGPAQSGPGPLGPELDDRLRLHPARRRRPGHQQGYHDLGQRQLLLRRYRPVADGQHDRRHLPAPGRPPGPQCPPLGHPDRQERLPDADRRRLLPGASVPRDVRRRPVRRRAGP